MKIKLIRRDQKRIQATLFEGATHCAVFDLDNSFRGAPVPVSVARKAYEDLDFAKLYDRGDRYVVHLHNNRWYELRQETAEDA